MISNGLPEAPQTPNRNMHLNLRDKSTIEMRLKRIEGQVRGVRRQVERNDGCDQVLNQIAAVHHALNSVGKLVLLHHLKSYLMNPMEWNTDMIADEMLVTMTKLLK